MNSTKTLRKLRRAANPRVTDELPVGRISGVFGIHGELKCDPTRAGRDLFTAGESLRAQLVSGSSESVMLESVREHKGRLLVRFAGVASPDDGARFTGASLHAPRARVRLEAGEYLDADLTGCALYERGSALGTVERVDHYPASDMLVVRGKLVPLIAEFVKAIDIEKKRIDVALPEGLLD